MIAKPYCSVCMGVIRRSKVYKNEDGQNIELEVLPLDENSQRLLITFHPRKRKAYAIDNRQFHLP